MLQKNNPGDWLACPPVDMRACPRFIGQGQPPMSTEEHRRQSLKRPRVGGHGLAGRAASLFRSVVAFYLFRRRRRRTAIPAKPNPSNPIVAGSGTGDWTTVFFQYHVCP